MNSHSSQLVPRSALSTLCGTSHTQVRHIVRDPAIYAASSGTLLRKPTKTRTRSRAKALAAASICVGLVDEDGMTKLSALVVGRGLLYHAKQAVTRRTVFFGSLSTRATPMASG